MKKVAVALLLGLVSTTVTAGPAPIPPADVVTVGTVNGASGGTIDVPVFIRDTSGTPLGIDQPPGSRIQSYALTVSYSPASSVQSITFTRAGITAPLTPTFESSPTAPGMVSLLDTFQESLQLRAWRGTMKPAVKGRRLSSLQGSLPGILAEHSTSVRQASSRGTSPRAPITLTPATSTIRPSQRYRRAPIRRSTRSCWRRSI